MDEMKVVVSGSGAAGIACAKMYRNLGVKNIIMLDSKGVIHTKRENLTPEKMDFAIDTDARTLADAMKGADMFLGLSKAGVLSKDMVASMAPNPIIFALANPTPEIMPEIAHSVRDDIMMGTGRSDYPNQVNNVLGFPFIFRGALDVRATKITENMKIAAADALAKLAEEEVPSAVTAAYNGKEIKFGKDYIIPKPFDPRVLFTVAPAVAEAAIKDGVALVKDFDKAAYIEKLKKLF
ncbi:NADP-dependent malic enzyme [Campylobacter hyointestinalis]|nr:NADP-dependent malic enzyme [Campylobacter hyointestinalis]